MGRQMRSPTSKQARAKKGAVRPLRPRIFWRVVQVAGLVPMTGTFALLFVVAAVIVAAVEPAFAGVGDAAWFLFTVVTTIGLGDFTCVTLAGRILTVVLSMYSVFYLALITGAIVSFCSESLKLQRDESVAAFLDQLEHLPELSPNELADLSDRIRQRRL